MNKAIQYGVNGAAWGFLGGGVIEFFRELAQRQENPYYEIDWSKVFKTGLKVGGTLGAVGVVAGLATDENNREVMKDGATLFLASTLSKFAMTEMDYPMERKVNKLIRLLQEKYSDKLFESPKVKGSYDNGAALIDSDVDISLVFKPKSFKVGSLRQELLNYFENEYQDENLIAVREQGCSVGLFFKIAGEERKIEIVPTQQIEGSNDLTLSLNSELHEENKTWMKTNPDKQSSYTSGKTNEKKIIQLLKIWKKNENVKFNSTYISYLVASAFIDKGEKMPQGIDNQLLFVLEYIANKIIVKKISDPSNKSNVISDKLTDSEKQEVADKVWSMLKDVRETPHNLASYFPNLND